MPWYMWGLVGLGAALVIYLALRFAYIWFFCGGNDGGNYYQDSQK